MRTLFIGSTKRGYQALKALFDLNAEVVGVISLRQDEHELERYEDAIRALAEEHGCPFYETKWLKDQDYPHLIAQELKPDIAFIVGCRIIISKEIYSLFPKGAVALHDSYLPDYRGFAPLNWSVLNGADHTGVTMFYLNELMDGGDIVAQKRVPIGPDDLAPQVYEKVSQATVDMIVETYPLLLQGKAPRIAQDYAIGNFTCSRNPKDGCIDWDDPTRVIYNLVRALAFPYPGAFTYYGGKKLTIWKAASLEGAPEYVGRVPGRVVHISPSDGSVDVLSGDGILRIFEVELEGGGRQPANAVITSVRATLGVRLPDLVERIAQLEQELARIKKNSETGTADPQGEPGRSKK